jgi:hypothetical protein
MSAARTGSPRVRPSRACPFRDLPRRSWRGGPGRRLESRIAAGGVGEVWRGQRYGTAAGGSGQAAAGRVRRAARDAGPVPGPAMPPPSRIRDRPGARLRGGRPALPGDGAGRRPLEAETGRRTLVTDRNGVCLPAGAPSRRYLKPIFGCLRCKRGGSRASARTRYLQWCLRCSRRSRRRCLMFWSTPRGCPASSAAGVASCLASSHQRLVAAGR